MRSSTTFRILTIIIILSSMLVIALMPFNVSLPLQNARTGIMSGMEVAICEVGVDCEGDDNDDQADNSDDCICDQWGKYT